MDWLQNFIDTLGWDQPLQLVGAVTGFAYVVLIIREKWYGWPIGILSTIITIWVLWRARFYVEFVTYFIYLGMMIYGWWYWLHPREPGEEPPITNFGAARSSGCLAGVLLLSVPVGFGVSAIPGASLAYLDSANTGVSLLAQWMQARKYMENWVLWMLANASYVVMFAMRDVLPYSILYAIFFLMAIAGWWTWKRSTKSHAAD